MTSIPTLKTERLILRALQFDDFGPYADFSASDASVFVSGPMDMRSAWRHFTSLIGHWPVRGYGWWAVDDGSGIVGTCGIHYPPSHLEPELGWVLFLQARGKGFATEAAKAARDWWYARGETRLSSNIAFDNSPSIAVARRLGATTDGVPLAHNRDCSAWLHPGPEGTL